MGKFKLFLLSLLSGTMMALAWPGIGGLSVLIYFSFVPLLMVENELSHRKASRLTTFFYAFLSFFVFNLLTTWWIYYASDWGAAMAIICNGLFMAVVFSLFHWTKSRVGEKQGYIGLVIYWIAFEYLHLNWELSWPWLTLGNVFAEQPEAVQWYEYTGILGGSLLILVVNLLLFFGLKKRKSMRRSNIVFFGAAIFLILTSRLISYLNLPEEVNASKEMEVLIVQPNIDPYLDKFSGLSESEQIDIMLRLTRNKITASTDLVLLPETAFPQPFWEHELEYMYGTEEFRKIIKEYPQVRIITGLLMSKLYLEGEERSATARKLPGEGYYDNYNAAMQLDSSKEIQLHRKSKLVLGVEKIPFIAYIPWMKKLSVNLGGSTGGYGTQETPSVFFNQNREAGIAPIICYESVYGEYMNQYARQSAVLYAIITNDGWWDDTPGYIQHLAYARLRAVEARRSIVRSANTGISAIINSRGEIVKQTDWWEPATLKGKVSLNHELTFYVKYGDYLGRIAAFVAPLLLLLTLVKKLNKTEQRLGKQKEVIH